MLSRWLFTLLWLGVVAQRLWEVRVSRRHEQQLKREGAVEHAPEQMPWMIAVHTGWLVCTLGEVWLLSRPFIPALGFVALALFGAGQALRLTAMKTLGERWTVRIITPREVEPVTNGIYRYVRHPNYLGVVLEIAALPLVHTAYLSAALFTALNAALLRARIRAEERALAQTSPYAERFRDRPRFVPGAARP